LAAEKPPAALKSFESVTNIITVKTDEGKPSALVKIDVEPEGDTQLAAIIIKPDGTYEYTDISYAGGKVTVAAKDGEKLQILQVKPGQPLDDFIPSYTSELFLQYMVDVANGEGGKYNEYVPEPLRIYPGEGTEFFQDLSNPYDPAFPKKLDQRGQPYISKTKAKSGFSWALSALSAVEALLGKKTGEVFDLSGLASGITGSSTVYSPSLLGGGNFSLSMAYMSELGGNRNGMKAARMASVKSYETMAYNISEIKRAITDYGSVVTAINSDTKSKAYNAKTYSYYTSDSNVAPNSMIQIIGWDNEFPTSKFTEKPEIAGAWIAKDSRGSSFGDSGYIYVSFADKTISQNLYVVTEASVAGDDEKQYSNFSSTPSAAVNFNSKTAWSANTFEVDSKSEKLTAVSFFSANADMAYEIWINDLGQMKAKKQLKVGKADNAGYITVDLNYPLTLRRTKFTIFVKMTTANVAHVPIEKAASKESAAGGGQSYISRDGNHWIDLAEKVLDANLCVRAWTTTQ
jgi:hypothetical protein